MITTPLRKMILCLLEKIISSIASSREQYRLQNTVFFGTKQRLHGKMLPLPWVRDAHDNNSTSSQANIVLMGEDISLTKWHPCETMVKKYCLSGLSICCIIGSDECWDIILFTNSQQCLFTNKTKPMELIYGTSSLYSSPNLFRLSNLHYQSSPTYQNTRPNQPITRLLHIHIRQHLRSIIPHQMP